MSELTNLVGKRTVKVTINGKVWDFYAPSFRLAAVLGKIEEDAKKTDGNEWFCVQARMLWEMGKRTTGWLDAYPSYDPLLDELDLDDLAPLMVALKDLQAGTQKAAEALGMKPPEEGTVEPFQPAGGDS